MNTIGQVTAGSGKYHLNLHGLAACGAGTGRIIPTTVIPATAADAWGKCCKHCQRRLAKRVNLDEATAALPRGYRLTAIRYWAGESITVTAPHRNGPCGDSAATPWDALKVARLHAGKAATSRKAAREQRERNAHYAAVGHAYTCPGCSHRLSDYDIDHSPVQGLCFNCA